MVSIKYLINLRYTSQLLNLCNIPFLASIFEWQNIFCLFSNVLWCEMLFLYTWTNTSIQVRSNPLCVVICNPDSSHKIIQNDGIENRLLPFHDNVTSKLLSNVPLSYFTDLTKLTFRYQFEYLCDPSPKSVVLHETKFSSKISYPTHAVSSLEATFYRLRT